MIFSDCSGREPTHLQDSFIAAMLSFWSFLPLNQAGNPQKTRMESVWRKVSISTHIPLFQHGNLMKCKITDCHIFCFFLHTGVCSIYGEFPWDYISAVVSQHAETTLHYDCLTSNQKNTSKPETVLIREQPLMFLQFCGTFVTTVSHFCLFCCEIHFILGALR